MKKETLKPCPFCGQEHTTITESNTEGIRIRCPKCNITFTRDFYEHRGELGRQRTIEAWNTRPEQLHLMMTSGNGRNHPAASRARSKAGATMKATSFRL
jgi:Lar family restriction alleviation protein